MRDSDFTSLSQSCRQNAIRLRSKILTVLLLSALNIASGQQLAQFALAQFQESVYNPGARGLVPSMRLTGLVRRQWSALPGSPGSQFMDIDLPLEILSGGVGLMLMRNSWGAHHILQAKLGYSYHARVGEEAILGIGLAGVYRQYAYSGDILRTPEGEYGNGVIAHHDFLLESGWLRPSGGALDVGIELRLADFAFGVSGTNIVSAASRQRLFAVTERPHWYAQVRYAVDVNPDLRLTAGAIGEANAGYIQNQAFLAVTVFDTYQVGVHLRGYGPKSFESVGLLGKIRLNDHFHFFYSYGHNILAAGKVFGANHEVAMIYLLNKQIGRGRLPLPTYNPRYF